MKLNEFVQIDAKRARSINLERDANTLNIIENYHLTGMGLRSLSRFVDALEDEPTNAWTLTGPYGMGKSAFANYLLALTAPQKKELTKTARDKLYKNDATLSNRYEIAILKFKIGRPFLHVVATSAYEPVNKSLARGLLHGLQEFKPRKPDEQNYTNLVAKVTQLINRSSPLTTDLLEAFQSASQICRCPLLIIIDEFGKNLEFQAHNPASGDLYALQLLAERENTFLFVLLHQAFREYASALSNLQREEWQKIHGRFEDLPFIEPPLQMISLIQKTLKQNQPKGLKQELNRWAKHFSKAVRSLGPSDIGKLTETQVKSLYPIHPLSAWLLTELCRRFAQNDRTLFSFLGSGDPLALPTFLESIEVLPGSPMPTLTLDVLYEYFADISLNNGRPESQRWLEIRGHIQKLNNLSEKHLKIVKIIGLLNILSNGSGLSANIEVIRCATGCGYQEKSGLVDTALSELTEKGVILFRDYAKEYRLWEGTDIDLSKEIQKARTNLGHRALNDVLEEIMPFSSLTASRHSYETGTIRDFERKWVLPDELTDPGNKTLRPQNADGLIVYVPGRLKALNEVPKACSCGRPLIIIYSPCADQIQNLALEMAASDYVFKNMPALAHDGVARREALYRAEMARKTLHTFVNKSFESGASGLCFYASGKAVSVNSRRDLSSLMSTLCNDVYKNCPQINNEMINQNKLSSAAARARRELAEAMVVYEGEEGLGLKGEGPEVAVYRTLFKATGLHSEVQKNFWRFIPPTKENENFRAVWNTIDDTIPQYSSESISVRDIIERLKMPNFGLREGPILLLICHYLIVNSDEIALYFEGSYKPYFGEAEIALMIKRPDLFSFRRYKPTGLSRAVVQAYMQSLNTNVLKFDEKVRNYSLLQIVAPLLRFMESLNQHARLTRRISLPAQKLRGAVLNSREPIQLLFTDIPAALGIEAVEENTDANNSWKNKLRDALQEALLELEETFSRLTLEVQDAIMEAFDKQPNVDEFHSVKETIRICAASIIKSCRDKSLKPVLGAMLNDCENDAEWACGVAGQVVKKPVDSWHDADLEPFKASMMDVADRIESLNKLVAAGFGLDADEAVVVTLTYTGGKRRRHVARLDEARRRELRQSFSSLFNQTEEKRATLLAMLSESFEEKK